MKVLTALFLSILFLTACGTNQQQTATQQPPAYSYDPVPMDDYWAKDNFDLQRAGDLLEESDNPEDFERRINEPNGINNLDLNGDGYADYISVQEFDDRYDDHSRGLSLFSRFGPDLVQEIATILFYRDEPNYPGSRIFLRGNDQLYGDNYYYETNWLDRDLGLVSYLYGPRDQYYVSPYYYDNYPSWYTTYQVVETPIYQSRVVELYPQPVFVYTNTAPAFYDRVKIKSPNNGLHLGQIHAKLVKPTKEQAEFIKNNPSRRSFARVDDKPGRPNPPRSDRGEERGNPGRDVRGAERGNPDRPNVGGNPNKSAGNPNVGGNPNKGGGNPNKGGGNPNVGGNPNKGAGNPNKGGGNPNVGGNPNKGGGNPDKGGGGNPNKGGGNPNKGGGKKP